jgi:hypothetical protein
MLRCATANEPSLKMASRTGRSNLGREIALVLAIKFLALFVIWSVWFSHPESSHLSDEQVGAAIYSSPPALKEGTRADAQP